jgi:glycogen phosphorylase
MTMRVIRREIPKRFVLPRRIARLGELAYNLWWCWNPDARRLFFQIDNPLWDQVRHNPVAFLQQVERPRVNLAMNDLNYLKLYDQVMADFDSYLSAEKTWFDDSYPELGDTRVAYFSFEFGIHETVPVYAGGLGILAGDHLKEASDLGIPLVAVGFIYRQGYFTQTITEDGWQETRNFHLNFEEMPIIPAKTADGRPLMISVELPGRTVSARVWVVRVGRVPLYLLDTDIEENSSTDRQLNARLYSSDPDVRISQEILLGIGGIRALRELGYDPQAFHMNEGHSAFLILERIRELVDKGLSFDDAANLVRRNSVFTTHTPVPAGIDQFPVWLVERFFYNYWPQLGLDRDAFIDLAHQAAEYGENFSMATLALRLSDYRNGVSELHGQVSRKMFNFLWQDRSEEDVPITHITNGVHAGSWLAHQMGVLFGKHLGPGWIENMDDPDLWSRVDDIPDRELWEMRLYLKRKLQRFITDRIQKQWIGGEAHPVQVVAGGVLLDPNVLTIGFARRFATYKRAYLILHDYERLLKMIGDAYRPVQIIFAGKAHPADEPGKLIIQQLYRAVKDSRTGGRLVFLEDYDMNIARYLVQGVDVWMNTPRRPNEASGTSGMKAALNGGLNFSVLDGWWHEAYNGVNGWAIGNGDYEDPDQQDESDAASMYEVLENEIIPMYYSKFAEEDLPEEWIDRMKNSIRTLAPQFNMKRMVKEYMNELYAGALRAVPEK